MTLLIVGLVMCQNPAQYAVTTCGTSGKGFTFPGASAPFGMIQWSPDTGPGVRKGGYSYNDSIVYGFSLDHLSGAGCTYAENFLFTPMAGDPRIVPPVQRTDFSSSFSHSSETARPGYYAVTLNDSIRVELTTRTRTGFGRVTYPQGRTATMVVNAGSNVRGTSYSSITIDTSNRSISGSATGGHFCNHGDVTTVYFYSTFDTKFASHGIWSDSTLSDQDTRRSGSTSGAWVTFNTFPKRTILVKVAISYVSISNAKANLESENPDSSFTSNGFDESVVANRQTWNSWLGKIEVSGGSTGDLRTFYSMMYHALLAPTVCSDVNGQYMGYDGNIHTTSSGRRQYANFSGWDTYRCQSQFLAMVAPDEASDMAQSLLVDYQQGGAFPRWGVPNEDSGVMVGDPSAAIIPDFFEFGATNFDAKSALEGLICAATDSTVKSVRTNMAERNNLSDYLELGYIPEGEKRGCVSTTLEYASADFALSQFAKTLGDSSDGALLLKHAENWRQLFNPSAGYIQMRRSDGTWAPDFKVDVDSYDNHKAYTEGTAGQYVWMVPFDLAGLADAMGGEDVAAQRLDTFFTELNAGFSSKYAYMGNEVSIEAPWIYNFFGRPYRTQNIVRRVMTELYSAEPDGLPGNDDLGTMSSWYVFGALGMYPELPGSDVLVLAGPLFPKATLHLKNGTVTITGNSAGTNSPYVQSLMINGRSWAKPWIRFRDISKGGEMMYELRSTPNSVWGSSPKDVPPSYP
ncbi:MAG TPA: GH92 family glycosyl hydrolase [Bacteroidota bacterium]|nr:GH92 family glycosyl hydrolase [Bacteroidota bacterium]